MTSRQIALINEDYEWLKFYRKQHPLALQRIDTLSLRIEKKDAQLHLKNEQIHFYQQADSVHLKRFDDLNEKYFSIVLENESYIRKNRRWLTLSAMLAAALTINILRP
jgi:hypothetical protein